jgi:hypothetical protein
MFGNNMKQLFAYSLCVLALGGCNLGFSHDEKIDGPYRLIAVDTKDQLSVCYELPSGDSIGRIPETVVAVGHNDEYIVAQRQLLSSGSIEYYYLIRKEDSVHADPAKSVRGPFTSEEFKAEKSSLNLPEFTRHLNLKY